MDCKSSIVPGAEMLLYLLPVIHSSGSGSGCATAINLAVVALSGLAMLAAVAMFRWRSRGGCAWPMFNKIPGPRGLPILGSLLEMGCLAHRQLAALAKSHGAEKLMALSLGNTRLVVASKPDTARDILNSSAFADRPLKQSAQQLMFGRAIGFAPYGDYWRGLRRIAANHLFSPKRIAGHESLRQKHTESMLDSIASKSAGGSSPVEIRGFLQAASLNNIMQSVFGRSFAFSAAASSKDGSHHSCAELSEAAQLQAMVREGFELLGAFNWSDHLPLLRPIDPCSIQERCSILVPKVHSFVQKIIDQHRLEQAKKKKNASPSSESLDFVDVLLNLSGEEKLSDEDMIAVLWEMIFRGTDTTAILTEWILAELVLHPDIQARLHAEIDSVVSRGDSNAPLAESQIAHMPLLQAVIKETLRMHPPGPLLSWARLAIHDTSVANHHIPAGTTAMINMWAITHDASVWEKPEVFNPDRFLLGAEVFDIKGSDLRLAPFGAGRRVCPGRALGIATVNLWTARLLHKFRFEEDPAHPVDLSEVLKLSCEMVHPLNIRAIQRAPASISSC